MSRAVQSIQMVLGVIAIGLVVALFAMGMVGGRNRDEQAQPVPSEGPQSGEPVTPGQRLPGMPERDLSEHETLPEPGNRNAERQLAYEAQGASSVALEDSLGEYEAYATQTIDWTTCGEHVCGAVLAPLDWDDPSGPAVRIALTRVAGVGEGRQPLFVNPGGPGMGGIGMAQSMQGRWRNYDLIGWDPRGTGESTHVVCGSGEQTDAWLNLDSSPDDDAEDETLRSAAAEFARQCRDGSGALLDHLSTIDVARDLDLLRHLLGSDTLNYFGVSYGTFIGATYAQLFPHSVGRMVLDAAVDITGDREVPQSAGFERALDNFIEWCADSTLCQLGDDRAVIKEDISTLLEGLEFFPIQVGDRQLTQSYAAIGLALFLYGDDTAYRTLASILDEAMDGDGEKLLLAADLYYGRADDGTYETGVYAFPAILCADRPDGGPERVRQEWRDTFDEAPTIAPNLGMGYDCQFWTADSAPQLKLTAPGAPPILVVGTIGDSATPYEQAVSMAEQLESGVLLTFDGSGHGAVSGDNECIAKAVDRYLDEGDPPEDGKTCR